MNLGICYRYHKHLCLNNNSTAFIDIHIYKNLFDSILFGKDSKYLTGLLLHYVEQCLCSTFCIKMLHRNYLKKDKIITMPKTFCMFQQLFETGKDGIYACFKCQPLVPEITIGENGSDQTVPQTSNSEEVFIIK